jgi:hypothetical protein
VRLRFGVRSPEDRPGTANRVDSRAVAAAAITVVLWASVFVSIRSSAGHFGPGALALGRLSVGALVLVVVLLVRREGLARQGVAGHRRQRNPVVRRVHGRAELGRAQSERGHGIHDRQRGTVPERVAAQGGFPAQAAGRDGGFVSVG